MKRMTVTPQLRAYVLHVVDTALLPPEDIFPGSSSAIEKAKSTRDGRQTVKQLEHHANAYEISDLELIVEVFTERLKARKLKLAKQRADFDVTRHGEFVSA